jgi:hypothetical protein
MIPNANQFAGGTITGSDRLLVGWLPLHTGFRENGYRHCSIPKVYASSSTFVDPVNIKGLLNKRQLL